MSDNNTPDEEQVPAIIPPLGDSKLAKADKEHPLVKQVLSAFPDDIRSKMELTESQVQQILNTTAGEATGLVYSIPMICKDDDCEFKNICIYKSMGIAPKDARCPDETLYIQHVVPQLIESLDVDTEDFVEWDMLREYVDAMVRERRAQLLLSVHGELGKRVSAIDQKNSIPFMETVVHPASQIHDKAQRDKRNLRKDFIATREQREKFKKREGVDHTSKLGSASERLKSAKADLANEEDAEYTEVKPEDTQQE